ncbi:lipocalin family protein [Undibacterium cyanobacteriorum]|uniref:Outer membrane lipoprotein Blc n=1 Tax=Undibacterium cyanobacteriorum TaxID=3073561 RepID=A0ABY9RD86_9BURK|nr:lipocalin family protein [Undibacterium sp. 20NA77.5]WMW79207.1 lipocalin family protein [Undibacterium sp. 20NA77.5]
MPTVDSVNLDRYLGKWYEITSIPNRFQAMCVSDTRAEYVKDGDRIKVINRCRKQDGKIETAEGIAKIVDGSNNAKLRVSFFRPFYGNYWVLDLDPDYQWVLVGEPSRKYAWVLSRNMQVDPQTLQKLMQKAESLGYQATQFKASVQAQSID